MRVLLVCIAATLAAACAESPDAATTSQAVLEGNRIVSNRVTSNRIEMNRIASNRIASNRITSNRLNLNAQTAKDLLKDAGGREVLTYLIGCAIPAGQRLEAKFQGVTYIFNGEIGLAPRWLDRSLREKEQRWVSACMISRVNKYEIAVPISIRGPHSSLAITDEEAEDFTVEEGAFYGDIFRPEHLPIIWVACRGRGQAVSESGPLDDRDCTEPDPQNPGFTLCGFTYAGDCADFSGPPTRHACDKFTPVDSDDGHGHHHHHGHQCDHDGDDDDTDDDSDMHSGGFYEKCHERPGFSGGIGQRYDEVITVFLTPS